MIVCVVGWITLLQCDSVCCGMDYIAAVRFCVLWDGLHCCSVIVCVVGWITLLQCDCVCCGMDYIAAV